jgi:hypothetical protein
MHDEEKRFLEAATKAIEACSVLSTTDDRLFALQLAWIILAQQARNDALAFPEGFPTERARQLAQLEKIALLVREDKPDLEFVRLQEEGNLEGVSLHLRKLLDDLNRGESDEGD